MILNYLLNDYGEAFSDFLVQYPCVGIYLVVSNFGVNPGRLNLAVSQHLADRFKRYSMPERDFRRVSVPPGMEYQRTVYLAKSGDVLQIEIHHAVAIHRKQPAVRCRVPVFLYDAQWQIQQGNFKLNPGLLARTSDPPCTVICK